jgi:hypothetical protein
MLGDFGGLGGMSEDRVGGLIRLPTSLSFQTGQHSVASKSIIMNRQYEHPGELIPSKSHTYHSIGELATLVQEH